MLHSVVARGTQLVESALFESPALVVLPGEKFETLRVVLCGVLVLSVARRELLVRFALTVPQETLFAKFLFVAFVVLIVNQFLARCLCGSVSNSVLRG